MAVTYYPQAADAAYFATCLAADTKPDAPPTGSLILEVDTARFFRATGGAWSAVVNADYINTTQLPAPPGGTTLFARADGTWAAPSGGGGGASATTVEVALGALATQGKFTITDAAIASTSKVMCWQAPGPYTGKGTRADEAELQPVQVVAVEAATGSAVVKWQTPPMLSAPAARASGRQNSASLTTGNQLPTADDVPRRIGKVGGNVKFSYVVFS